MITREQAEMLAAALAAKHSHWENFADAQALTLAETAVTDFENVLQLLTPYITDSTSEQTDA